MENPTQKDLDKKLIEEVKNSAPIYSIVPECVMQNPELSKNLSAFRTFTILNSYAGSTGACWASNKKIQEKYPDQTETVIRKNLKILIDQGFVFRALDRSSKKGTKRILVFVGNWREYFERCKKVGNLREATSVQSFFERRPLDQCFEEIQKNFNTRQSKPGDHPATKAGSIEQNKESIKETTVKKRQEISLKRSQKPAAAASFPEKSTFDQKLQKNLGVDGMKRALAFWNSLEDEKQRNVKNPVAFLTSAIKGNWDKENKSPLGEYGFWIRSAFEINREFALNVNELIQTSHTASSHVGKDYLEIYNGSWNKVFNFGESSTTFKANVLERLEKMGIKSSEIKKENNLGAQI
ncbi:MAG: helix-turn-helix domain-containing protein [Chlamydiia bacterium]|nr:helix-turn-helix domain-containing protein [Chlamydiia bacterium]